MSETREQAPTEPVPDTVEQAHSRKRLQILLNRLVLTATAKGAQSQLDVKADERITDDDIDKAEANVLAAADAHAAQRLAAGAQGEREALRAQDWHIRRLREALEMIASPGDLKDYGWWTERARKALAPPDAPVGREYRWRTSSTT